MLNKKGFTLIETLLAFSIYITCIVVFISIYSFSIHREEKAMKDYDKYINTQIERENNICYDEYLTNTIIKVLS